MSVSLPHCSAISLQILHIHSGLQFPWNWFPDEINLVKNFTLC
jgi:hypothetical protein